VPGASAPKLVRRSDLSALRRGAVLVDVAIDQGGCFETSRPTTHDDPAYTVDGIVHYCVANMPGAVARTSTEALTQATVGYITQIAELGVTEALRTNPHLADGLNIAEGRITHPGVAKAMAADLAA
jgi:alanine dehydrogenase